MASLTKLLVTAPLIIDRFYRQRRAFHRLTLGEVLPTDSPLPARLKALSIQSLLSHSSGLRPWLNFYVNRLTTMSAADLRSSRHAHLEEALCRASTDALFLAQPHAQPKPTYSDIGYILLGYALEQESGQSIAVLFADWCRELGLPEGSALYFAGTVNPALTDLTAISTGSCPVRQRILCGEVHDENAASLGGLAGHAGLFASLPALSALLPGWYVDHRVQTLIELTADNAEGVGFRRGDDATSRLFGEGHSIGHYGFTGTSLWLHPDSHHYSLMLTNRVIAGRLALANVKKHRQMVYRWSADALGLSQKLD